MADERLSRFTTKGRWIYGMLVQNARRKTSGHCSLEAGSQAEGCWRRQRSSFCVIRTAPPDT